MYLNKCACILKGQRAKDIQILVGTADDTGPATGPSAANLEREGLLFFKKLKDLWTNKMNSNLHSNI